MSAHAVLFDIHKANAKGLYAIADPGNAGTIGGAHGVDRSPGTCALVSAGAETRTLGRPTAAGDRLVLFGQTVAGTITVTVTGGYNANGDTTFTITAANQFYEFLSVYDGTNYGWRITDSYAGSNSGLTLSAPSTPTAVATSPGTAAAAELTATGGVGGNSTLATTAVGGIGGGYSFTAGAGGVATAGVTASTGGAGGALAATTGAGGAEAVATVTSTGGAGGAASVTTGAGGAVSAAVSGTATGGASGALTLTTGTGGAVTATTGTNVGGASGAVTLSSGVGGAATGATDTGGAGGAVAITGGTGGLGDTGGAGASVTITAGDGGVGSGTGGAAGGINLVTGTVGTGGAPTPGAIKIKMAGTERWGFYGTTVGVFTSLGAVPTNINAAGTILPGGGVAITDVLNAWIDDSTHGSGTVAHLIGNQTITTSSDSRIKRNIADYTGNALDAVMAGPRVVTFEYDHPDWGGDRAAEGDDNARLWGPNARGEFVGFIAQETIDAFPWVVNPGAGKDCPTCRAGKKCDNPDHPIWHVEYQHLVPLLMQAVRELNGKVVALEAKLAERGG